MCRRNMLWRIDHEKERFSFHKNQKKSRKGPSNYQMELLCNWVANNETISFLLTKNRISDCNRKP